MGYTFPPFRLQPPIAVPIAWFGFISRLPRSLPTASLSGPERHLGFTLGCRLATTMGRIEFVNLRTSSSPPVALHALSRDAVTFSYEVQT